jgi:hypothetical protein
MSLKRIGYGVAVAAMTVAFALASATPSEAAKKKKTAAAPPPPPMAFCAMPYAPVCATKGGLKFTYANACFAAKDGAKVVSQKACPAPKAKKAKKGKKKAAKKKAK